MFMSAKDKFMIYPVPVEEEQAIDYELTVNSLPVFTYKARVSAHPLNQIWPGYQRTMEQTEVAAFSSWDMSEPVEVSIMSSRPVQDVRVRPASAGIKPHVEDGVIRFTITKPGQFTVEVNGTHHALHLFANPPEDATPDKSDPNVRYFGPGVHCPGLIRMESNQTVYLAGGAVVYGAILAEKAENIAILGRGILDGSKFDRLDGLTALVCLYDCDRVRIEGITLRDSGTFTFAHLACRQVRIRNVKVIGGWRYNSDGINFINCRHCSVEDSFARTFDDCICLKGYEKFGNFIYKLQLPDGMSSGSENYDIDGVRGSFAKFERSLGAYACNGAPISDIQVRRCVLWNAWGKALEIGIETVTDEISDILFEDCDIIHVQYVAMDVTTHDRARCKNILFRNIRVELDADSTPPVVQQRKDQLYEVVPGDNYSPYLIMLYVGTGYCTIDSIRGCIEDVRFQDIEVTSRSTPPSLIRGHDAEHMVQRVSVENLRINGQVMTSLEAAGFKTNEFTRDISIREKTRAIESGVVRNKVDSQSQPPLGTDPSETVCVKSETAKMPETGNKGWSGGLDLCHIQVFGPGRGLSAYGSLQPSSVSICSDGRRLEEGRDYVVDYDWGKIGIGSNPSVKAGDPISINYAYRLRRIDSLVKDADGKEIFVKGVSHLNVPDLPVLQPGQKRLANLFVDYACDGSNAEIFPVTATSTDAKTASTCGMIPATLVKIKTGQPVKIVCWGDSVTEGGDASKGNAYTDVFSRMLKDKFPRADITVSVVAVGGSNSANWLEPEKHPFRLTSKVCSWEKVAAEKPDLVTLEFVNDVGLTDADFSKQYDEILRRVKELNAELILITPHFTMPAMMGFRSLRERESRPYVIALKKFAQDKRLALADASARWEHLADEGIPYVILLKNSINHPDDRGHRMFAEELWKCFR